MGFWGDGSFQICFCLLVKGHLMLAVSWVAPTIMETGLSSRSYETGVMWHGIFAALGCGNESAH